MIARRSGGYHCKIFLTFYSYTFYDGPPFATGLPHYGHILAGTIKDVVTRYAHQQGTLAGKRHKYITNLIAFTPSFFVFLFEGYHVERRFGWDCHGLPVEYEIDKTLNIKGPDDVARMGIANYNNECRKIVMRYATEWELIVNRMGRWIGNGTHGQQWNTNPS